MFFLKNFSLLVSLLLSLLLGTSLYLVSISSEPRVVKQSSLEVAGALFEKIQKKKRTVTELYNREDGLVAWSTVTTWIESSGVGVFYPRLSEHSFSIFLRGEGPFREVFNSRYLTLNPNKKYFIEWSIEPLEGQNLELKVIDGDREIILGIKPGAEKRQHYFQPTGSKILIQLNLQDELIPITSGEVARINFINVIQLK